MALEGMEEGKLRLLESAGSQMNKRKAEVQGADEILLRCLR